MSTRPSPRSLELATSTATALSDSTPSSSSSSTLIISLLYRWLGVLIARLTGAPLEDYFQARIFAPLGIKTSTFYPYKTAELKAKVMPTRWFDEDKEEYQELVHQFPGLTLPRE